MKPWRQAVGWLVLSGLVVFGASRAPWGQTLGIVAGADLGWLLLAVAAHAAILGWTTVQWLLFTPRRVSVSSRTVLSVVGLVASVSNSGPSPLGYPAGVRLLTTRAGLTTGAAASVLVLEQLADSVAKLMLLGVVAAWWPGMNLEPAGFILLAGLPMGAVGLVALSRRPQLLDRAAAASPGPASRVLQSLARALAHLETLQDPRRFGAAVALGVAKKAMESVGIFAVASSLGVTLPLWALVAAPLAANLALMVSVVPAGLGVYEGATFLVFVAAGIAPEPALAVALLSHATYLLPLVGSGWAFESARVARGLSGRGLLLGALAAVGVGIHLWFALGGDALDADRAFVLLMARHFALGEWSVYLWEQNYMASLEPALLAPLAAVGLATPLAAGLVGMALTSAMALISVHLARRLGGAPWMAALLWAVPPALVVHHHVALYGARLAATLIVLSAFVWALSSRSSREWVAIGALAGLAYFGDHMMLPWAAAVMFVAARRGGLGPAAAGALVLVGFDTVAAMMTPAFHLSGPNFPRDWILNVPLLVGTALPQLFGLVLSRGPTPGWEPLAPILPDDGAWLASVLPGLTILLLLITTLIRRREHVVGREAPEEGVAGQALLLACLVNLGLFVFVGGGGETWSTRYLVPLWPALSVLLAVGVRQAPIGLRRLSPLLVLPAAYTLMADTTWPRAGDGAPARQEAEAIHRAVTGAGLDAVWAEYWDAYRMALLTGESPRWVTYRGIERHPDWVRTARDAEPVGYLIRVGDDQMLSALVEASTAGIARLDDVALGRFRLVVMERSVPGLEFRNPAPSRPKQLLAALSAGLLFCGTLVSVGLLARLSRPPWRREPSGR